MSGTERTIAAVILGAVICSAGLAVLVILATACRTRADRAAGRDYEADAEKAACRLNQLPLGFEEPA